MPDIRRVAVVLLSFACTPTSSSPTTTPAAGPAATTASAETCLLGDYRVFVQQRMVQDSGETALLEDQRIGEVPVLFAAQRKALRERPGQDGPGQPRPRVPGAPQTLLLVAGAQVTEDLEDLEYVPHPDGAKPTATTTTNKSYTFFLAEAAWDCAAAAAEIEALKLPQGQVGAAACVPAGVRAGRGAGPLYAGRFHGAVSSESRPTAAGPNAWMTHRLRCFARDRPVRRDEVYCHRRIKNV